MLVRWKLLPRAQCRTSHQSVLSFYHFIHLGMVCGWRLACRGSSRGVSAAGRPALLPQSPSGLGTLGSGSDGRLRSGSRGPASLSGLPELAVALAPLSLSGGWEGLLTVSETGPLAVGALAAEQLPSVSVSAGGVGGASGLALPLSAVLHLQPALTGLSRLLRGLWRPLPTDL